MNIERKYLLSWQDQVLGPHSVEEIKSLLSDRKIHSLFKVKSDGSEVLVREFLANLNDDRKRASAAQAEAVVAPPAEPAAAIIRATGDPEGHQVASEATVAGESENPPPPPTGGEATFGYAVTSFILSLLFILPLINLVSWVMSLIFGHMFLYALKGDRTQRGYAYAWCGVWLTYIFGVFYLITCVGCAVVFSSNRFIRIEDWLPMIHGLMLGGAIASSVVSGLLIGGTKMITGATPKTGVAFVAGTLGVMAGVALGFLLGLMAPEAVNTENTAMSVYLGGIVFLIQAIAWSEMIRIKDGEKLGLGRAALLSLFCSVCYMFLVFILFLISRMYS